MVFKVSEAGRQRVIREKRKNVHASVYGYFAGECEMDTSEMTEVTYNPYKLGSFIVKETGEEIHSVDQVYFENGKSFI